MEIDPSRWKCTASNSSFRVQSSLNDRQRWSMPLVAEHAAALQVSDLLGRVA